MSRISDSTYLREAQYKTSANLAARANLHRRFSANTYGWTKWAYDQLALQPGMRVLEVGGGPGWLWRENIERLPPDVSICFSDFSFGMAQEARQAIPQRPERNEAQRSEVEGRALETLRFTFVNLDTQAIPFAAGTFDLVVANHMLYHVPDLPRAAHEMARVLRPGGRLCAATNSVRHLRQLHNLIHEFDSRYPEHEDIFAALFGLDNAPELLGRDFAHVEVRRYPDELWVTEVESLADYVCSSSFWGDVGGLEPGGRAALEDLIREKMKAIGGLRITKDSGMVIASL